jgi:hypothetical protein
MVNKMEIAQAIDASPGMMVDSVRHFHVFGSVDFENVNMNTGAVQTIFIAPFGCKVVECLIRFGTVETTDSNDEVLDLKKAASGTAIGSGTAVITQISLDPTDDPYTADTNYICAVKSDGSEILVAGDMVAFVVGGTVDEITGCVYAVKFERLN